MEKNLTVTLKKSKAPLKWFKEKLNFRKMKKVVLLGAFLFIGICSFGNGDLYQKSVFVDPLNIDIEIVIMGSGGMESGSENHKICPNQSQEVCATIKLKDLKANYGKLYFKNDVYLIDNIFYDKSDENNQINGNNLIFKLKK